MDRRAESMTSGQLRSFMWQGCKAASKGIVYVAPWAMAIFVIDVVLVWRVAREAGFEVVSTTWIRVVIDAAWDRDGFIDTLLPGLAKAFSGTIGEVEHALRVGAIIAAIATTWLQALGAAAGLEPSQRRSSVVIHAIRRWPSVLLAWTLPMAVLWALVEFALRPAGTSGNPWLAWSVLAGVVALVVIVFPRLVLVPALAVGIDAPLGTGWARALARSVTAVHGRMDVVWGIIGWGAFWPVAAVAVVTLTAAVAAASTVVLSIAIVSAGIPLALSGLAAAGAAVFDELGIDPTDPAIR